MRNFFSRLFKGNPSKNESVASNDALIKSRIPKQSQPAHLSVPTTAATTANLAANNVAPQSFVRREAVINRQGKIIGYEFSLMSQLKTRIERLGNISRQGFDTALLTRLVSVSTAASLLQNRLAFVNLSIDSLENPLLDSLPAKNTVLLLDLSGPANAEKWAERLNYLSNRGFTFGVCVSTFIAIPQELNNYLTYIQLTTTQMDGIELHNLLKKIKNHDQSDASCASQVFVMASKILSHEDFEFCLKAGFDMFQGPFIGQRQHISVKKNAINRAIVLPVLNMIRKDAEFQAIADQLKNEPVLTFKLLRYLNSPAMGLSKPVESLSHALVILGKEKMYRWLSLLLFDFNDPSYQERALAEQSLARGRVLEQLAGQGNVPDDADNLFLIGLFSLLDVAMGKPLPELLAEANMPLVVHDALTQNTGPYAEALAMAILGEANANDSAPDALAQAFMVCGVDEAAFVSASTQALAWAHELLSEADA